MQGAMSLGSLLVLGLAWMLQAGPVLQDDLIPIQENFDLGQFMGKWNEVAVVSSCPYYMEDKRENPVIVALDLQQVAPDGNFTMTSARFRNGTCKHRSTNYRLTDTPGRFFNHVAKWGADVDGYVVHTNYNEYAIIMMSKQKSGGDASTSLKLFSRSMTVRDTVLEDFKTLVRDQGMSDDNITIKQNKGDCVPGEVVAEPTAQPEAQRRRRDVVPSLVPADVEGSGDDTPLFNGSESCKAAPDTGPCFGLHQRYYYNSSSMSCALFNYGGCMGNQNNFENERECLQRCRTEAVCRLPMAAMPCTGQLPVWAFVSSVGLCVPYKQGFCQGNANKFYSKAECDEYCGVVNDEGELLKAN
ncbi:protein AMBP isoform X1 [Trematomus bernacchii]|uniref:protein AMBP isoform X1 n=1 Tax=Trematomus bernacchii TaxID=40690 RepID=UPI00146B04E8|nr:protein AMBP isoform X1 [Trematomus bernacchii]